MSPQATAGARRRLPAPVLFILATAAPCAAAEEGIPYAGDLGQAIAGLAIFLVLLVVLTKYAWRPITAQLRDREERIRKQLDDARKRQQKSEDLLAEYQAQLQRAEQEARKVVEESRKQAARDREEMIAEARREAEKHAEQTRVAIEQARLDTIRELQQQTAELAAEIAERVLIEGLDESTHRRLVARGLDEIRARAGESVS